MASTYDHGPIGHGKSYRRQMSTHLAAAMMSFALLQIVVVAGVGGSILLYLGAIVTVGCFAVVARRVERRWTALENGHSPDLDLMPRFRRDLLRLWLATVLGALLWLPVGIGFRALAS